MAISANAYQTTSDNFAYTNPIIWSPTAEAYIYENAVLQQFAINDGRFLNQPGRQGNYTLNTAYSTGLLTEGVPTPVSALTYNQVTITFNAYGDAKQITDEELVTGFSYIIDDIRQGALGSMGENRDSVIMTELLTTTSTGIYPNSKTSSTIASTDTFNTDMIADVDRDMLKTQARRCEAIVIHPNQKGACLKLAQFTNAAQYGSDAVIRTGEIGNYLGKRIVVSNSVTNASENSTTVYKAIAFGRRPFIYAQKRNFEFNFEREKLRDRAVTVSWWEMFGVSVLIDNSVIVLTSA